MAFWNRDILKRMFVQRDEFTSHKTVTPLDHPDGSVTTAKIADGAVTDAKVANVSWTKLLNRPFDAVKLFEDTNSYYSGATGTVVEKTASLDTSYNYALLIYLVGGFYSNCSPTMCQGVAGSASWYAAVTVGDARISQSFSCSDTSMSYYAAIVAFAPPPEQSTVKAGVYISSVSYRFVYVTKQVLYALYFKL